MFAYFVVIFPLCKIHTFENNKQETPLCMKIFIALFL